MLKPKVRISRLTQTLDALAEWLNTIYVAVDDEDGNTMKVPLTDFVKRSDFTTYNTSVSHALSQVNGRISAINSAINAIENELGEKADVSALNTQVTALGNSITTLTQQLAQLNTELQSKANTSDVTALDGRVTQVEYDVGLIKNQIPLLVGFHVITNASIGESALSRNVEEGELAWYFNEDAGQIELYEALKDIAEGTSWNPADWKAVDINEVLKGKAEFSQLEASNQLLDSLKINKDQIAPFADAEDTILGEVFIDRSDGKLKKCIVDEPGEHVVVQTSVVNELKDVFIAVYDVTSYEDIVAAKNAGEVVVIRYNAPGGATFVLVSNFSSTIKGVEIYTTDSGCFAKEYKCTADGWSTSTTTLADKTYVDDIVGDVESLLAEL